MYNNCQRCGKENPLYTIMSMFNTQIICDECKDKEEKDPMYEKARKADEDAIKNGDFNFKGIGI